MFVLKMISFRRENEMDIGNWGLGISKILKYENISHFKLLFIDFIIIYSVLKKKKYIFIVYTSWKPVQRIRTYLLSNRLK